MDYLSYSSLIYTVVIRLLLRNRLPNAIVVSAAISRYDGLIQLKLGWEGAQLTIDGRNEILKPR